MSADPERLIIPEMDPKPSDAELLETVIERRFKDLLALAAEPKELAESLKAATAWWKAKKELTQGDGYGSRLGRGIMRDE